MVSRRNVSPDEHASSQTHRRTGGGRAILAAAAAFFLLTLFCPVVDASSEPSGTPPREGQPVPTLRQKKPSGVANPAKTVPTARKPSPAKNESSKPPAAAKKKPQPAPVVNNKTKAKAETLVAELSPVLPTSLEQEIGKFFGLRYRLGGDGREGFDCSGLVKRIYEDAFGIRIPRSSIELSRFDHLQPVSPEELKPGDLVFFGPNRKRVNHVGLYLSGGRFLHAARSEGVTISSLEDQYWKSRFMFSRRMRGLELEEEREDSATVAFERELRKDAYIAGLGKDELDVRFLEAGIEINDTIELLVSGFFLSALDPAGIIPAAMDAASGAEEGNELKSGDAGFRVGAAFSPFEWIKLIPSIFQSESDKGERSERQQRMGLETWMILPESRVAVFLAAHARNQEDLLQRPLEINPDMQTADFSLGLHYQFSDALRFSLWGSHAYRPETGVATDDTGRRASSSLDQLSFQFRLQF